MATTLDYLSFLSSLRWYKRYLFFPLLLNRKERKRLEELINSERTELDDLQDQAYFAWNRYTAKIEEYGEYNVYTRSAYEEYRRATQRISDYLDYHEMKKRESRNPLFPNN